MAADMASDAINNPGNRRMQNVVNSLSENKLKEAAQEMVKDSGINIDSAKWEAMSVMTDKEIPDFL